MKKFKDAKSIPLHISKGGPGDMFLGGGKVDTTNWFRRKIGLLNTLDHQVKDQDIWFCAAPFQMLYTTTYGEFRACSWALEAPGHENLKGPNITDTSIEDYFVNDENLNQLRHEMTTPGSDLALSKIICKACVKQEADYGRSRRQFSLKIQTNDGELWPLINDAVAKFKETNEVKLEGRMFEVQIKAFGNQCNLDCYMCMPFDSTTRLKSIHSPELASETIFDDSAKFKILGLEKVTLDSVIDQIGDIAPHIYNLKLIGGEPLVMKKFYGLLEKIVDSGASKDIMVKYQTNMSVLEFERLKITKYIPHFRVFEFTVSLDAIGAANNYIRRRSNWDEIVDNIKAVNKYPNVRVNVNGTISFLSVLRFHELIEWFDDNKDLFDQINWSNIRGPAKLCANILPHEIKEKLIEKYEGFPDIQNVLMEDTHVYDYQDTLDYLLMNDKYYKGTKWEMNLFDVFPELEEYHIPQDEKTDYELIGSSNE